MACTPVQTNKTTAVYLRVCLRVRVYARVCMDLRVRVCLSACVCFVFIISVHRGVCLFLVYHNHVHLVQHRESALSRVIPYVWMKQAST